MPSRLVARRRGVPTIIDQPHPADRALAKPPRAQWPNRRRPPCPASEGVGRLPDRPAVDANVLADLAVEADVCGWPVPMTTRVRGRPEALLRRTFGGRQVLGKRSTAHAAEALERLGGKRLRRDSRDAPALTGRRRDGHLVAQRLDTLRAMATRPACVEVLLTSWPGQRRPDPRLTATPKVAASALGDL